MPMKSQRSSSPMGKKTMRRARPARISYATAARFQARSRALRYRGKDFRLICRLEKSVLIVVVVAVGHRFSVYEP